MPKIKRPATYVSENRDVQTQAAGLSNILKQADGLFQDLDTRLSVLETPGVVPPVQYTFLWWPCTDLVDSGASTTLVNRASGSATLTATGNAGNYTGMTPSGQGFARIYGSSGGYSGAGSATPTGATSLSAWVRLGSTANKNILGFFGAAAAKTFTITTDASSRLVGTANTTAGAKTIGGTDDLTLSPNVWYFMWLRFTGTELAVGLDSVYERTTFAATTMSWGVGTWNVGYAGTNTGIGIYRDIRVPTWSIPESFVNASYAAWYRLADR